MARKNSPSTKSEFGIIVLGNAGAGKSFICNLLIGTQRFEADFRPEAVTTVTEHHRIKGSVCDYLIYNIPGLVEVNQKQIDQNKQEIMKAFSECPTSVVLFVWTQIGGRVQSDDVIAFKALNDAYKFPPESLMFVVNNVPPNRPPQYEGQFIVTLTNALTPIPISAKDTIFIDNLDLADKAKTDVMTAKLKQHISLYQPVEQRKHQDIFLQSDQLKEMRNLLKIEQQKAERDREQHQEQVTNMTAQYRRARNEANRRYRDMEQRLTNALEQHKKERQEASQRHQQLEEEMQTTQKPVTLKCGGQACSRCGKCQTHEAVGFVRAFVSVLTVIPALYLLGQTTHHPDDVCQC